MTGRQSRTTSHSPRSPRSPHSAAQTSLSRSPSPSLLPPESLREVRRVHSDRRASVRSTATVSEADVVLPHQQQHDQQHQHEQDHPSLLSTQPLLVPPALPELHALPIPSSPSHSYSSSYSSSSSHHMLSVDHSVRYSLAFVLPLPPTESMGSVFSTAGTIGPSLSSSTPRSHSPPLITTSHQIPVNAAAPPIIVRICRFRPDGSEILPTSSSSSPPSYVSSPGAVFVHDSSEPDSSLLSRHSSLDDIPDDIPLILQLFLHHRRPPQESGHQSSQANAPNGSLIPPLGELPLVGTSVCTPEIYIDPLTMRSQSVSISPTSSSFTATTAFTSVVGSSVSGGSVAGGSSSGSSVTGIPVVEASRLFGVFSSFRVGALPESFPLPLSCTLTVVLLRGVNSHPPSAVPTVAPGPGQQLASVSMPVELVVLPDPGVGSVQRAEGGEDIAQRVGDGLRSSVLGAGPETSLNTSSEWHAVPVASVRAYPNTMTASISTASPTQASPGSTSSTSGSNVEEVPVVSAVTMAPPTGPGPSPSPSAVQGPTTTSIPAGSSSGFEREYYSRLDARSRALVEHFRNLGADI
ncbi:uncharacterized protein V1516DRAFT_146943 [Lipomyces oligophaga]|uniref:uncharacterized protein n=1 Tax=Lipomyces oligophaga TaxID=45792 RepID=UPI0034CF3461